MCGIAGVWERSKPLNKHTLARMGESLSHRGPDDKGIYIDQSHGVGLAHQRLSIIDLSMGGHQPMIRGDLVCVYNGEIYNFREIRAQLKTEGIQCTSDSDTEVLMQAFARWGTDAAKLFRGMFAFTVWDSRRQVLTLCRDRIGVKPLYYYASADRFVFASEVKAILAHEDIKREIDPDSLALFLRFGYIPSPHGILKGLHKLEPGYFLEVDLSGALHKKQYWNIASIAQSVPFLNDEESIISKLETLLADACELRMVSDVPVGIFLSGGIDSSLVTALVAKRSGRSVHTFTVGFEEDDYNEAVHARNVARHLGTHHHETTLSLKKASEIVETLPEMFDEPFAGGSAIPTFLVSEFARRSVKVAISADGGDELFGGYGLRYPTFAQIYKNYAKLPRLAGIVARGIDKVLPSALTERTFRLKLLAAQKDIRETYTLLNKRVFSRETLQDLMISSFSSHYDDVYARAFREVSSLDPVSQLQLVDLRMNLADNIMTKVDRASMAVGLESREPLLDPLLIEFAASISPSLKWKDGVDKYLLKQVLYKYVPRHLVDRPKHGFSMPLRALLTRTCPELIEEYLDEQRIRREGILNPEAITKEKRLFFHENVSPARIWRLVMFQMWKERWVPS